MGEERMKTNDNKELPLTEKHLTLLKFIKIRDEILEVYPFPYLERKLIEIQELLK